jgi:hypothetical protein
MNPSDGMHPHHPHALTKSSSFSLTKTPSFMGFGKGAQAGVKNIAKIKTKRKSERNLLASEFHYKPKVSQTFLQDWLDYPVDRHVHAFFNSFAMWVVYLQWTNKGMAGLDPLDSTIRARVCSQLQILGTVASLFVVIAIASFLDPPGLFPVLNLFFATYVGCSYYVLKQTYFTPHFIPHLHILQTPRTRLMKYG